MSVEALRKTYATHTFGQLVSTPLTARPNLLDTTLRALTEEVRARAASGLKESQKRDALSQIKKTRGVLETPQLQARKEALENFLNEVTGLVEAAKEIQTEYE